MGAQLVVVSSPRPGLGTPPTNRFAIVLVSFVSRCHRGYQHVTDAMDGVGGRRIRLDLRRRLTRRSMARGFIRLSPLRRPKRRAEDIIRGPSLDPAALCTLPAVVLIASRGARSRRRSARQPRVAAGRRSRFDRRPCARSRGRPGWRRRRARQA
jgi:hypothetical protein